MNRATRIAVSLSVVSFCAASALSSTAWAQDAPPAEPPPEAPAAAPGDPAKPATEGAEEKPAPSEGSAAPEADAAPPADARPTDTDAAPEPAEMPTDLEAVDAGGLDAEPGSEGAADEAIGSLSHRSHAEPIDYDHDLTVDGRVRTMIVKDASFDMLARENLLPGTALTIGYGAESLGGLRLLLQLHNAFGDGLGDEFSDSLTLDWSMTRYMVGAEYGLMLWEFLHPFARANVGYSTQTLTLTTSGDELHDRTHDLALGAAVGSEVFLELSRSKRVTLGFGGEFGYSLQTAAVFDELEVDEDSLDEDDPWTRAPVELGTLDVDGMYWDLGLTLRVRF